MFGIKKLKSELEATKLELHMAMDALEDLQRDKTKAVDVEVNEELTKCRNDLEALYEAAHARQKSPDARPSEYMKGISASITTINQHFRRDVC